MNAVQFDMAYRFPEYRAFVFEHFTHVTGRRLGFLGGSLVSVVAAVAFVRKKSKMPLDEAQKSSLETLLRGWEETVGAQQVVGKHS